MRPWFELSQKLKMARNNQLSVLKTFLLYHSMNKDLTSPKTHFILSLDINIFDLKMMVKSGLIHNSILCIVIMWLPLQNYLKVFSDNPVILWIYHPFLFNSFNFPLLAIFNVHFCCPAWPEIVFRQKNINELKKFNSS